MEIFGFFGQKIFLNEKLFCKCLRQIRQNSGMFSLIKLSKRALDGDLLSEHGEVLVLSVASCCVVL